jgi:importin subunit alpha-1
VGIRKLLSKEKDPPVESVLEAGVLPRLVALLQVDDAKLQFEASWAITNIASTEYTAAVVEAGAVPYVVAGMLHADANVRDQCVWCCGNIAGDRVEYRDMLLRIPETLYGLLMNIKHAASVQLMRNATWTLSNLCRGKPSVDVSVATAVSPALSFLLSHTDREVLADALWGLSYLTDGDERLVQTVVDSDAAPKCVALLGHGDVTVVMPAVRIVGNLICGNDRQTQAALDAGALRALQPLLGSAKRNIRREACWAVSNVAAGTQAQISALLSVPGLMGEVITQLKTAEFNVRKEACYVVSNVAANGTGDHIRQVVALGAIPPLTEMLRTQDTRILFVVLETMSHFLGHGGAGGGVSYAELFEEANAPQLLEALQQHPNEEVYNKCVELITKYWPEDGEEGDDGEDENAPGLGGGSAAAGAAAAKAPAVVDGVFAFGMGMSAGGAPFGMNSAMSFNFMTPPSVAQAAAAAAAAASCAPGGSNMTMMAMHQAAVAQQQQQQQQQQMALAQFYQQQAAPAYAAPAVPMAAAPPAAGGFNFSGMSFV